MSDKTATEAATAKTVDWFMVDLTDLLMAVAEATRVPVREMKSTRRPRGTSRAREIFAHLARVELKASYSEIGRALNKHHTSAIHAARSGERASRIDSTTKRILEVVYASLTNERRS